jgi:hypothetical protein
MNFIPYTTINDSGYVYKHTSEYDSGNWVGNIKGRSVYNLSGDYLGYAGTDGKVYKNYSYGDDRPVGWVDGSGNVYNNAGVQVFKTTRGVVGAAAYLLLIYLGGVR